MNISKISHKTIFSSTLEIIKIVNTNQNPSPGHDGIGNFIVKIAKTIPIYKKDDAEIFSNYRPVSILPCFSKLFKKLLVNRCIDYIN